MPGKVFEVSGSLEEGRPEIDLEDPACADIDWGEVEKAGTSAQARAQLKTTGSDGEPWDFYSLAGTLGVASRRMVELFRPAAGQHVRFVPLELDARRYFLLLRGTPLDCLDREASELEYFRSDPEQVKRVTRFEFRPEALSDPLLFTIPESLARLFATQTALNAAVGSGLTGISFREVWASRP